jgi:hypothetical protein
MRRCILARRRLATAASSRFKSEARVDLAKFTTKIRSVRER